MKEITPGQKIWKKYLRPIKEGGIILIIILLFSFAGFSQHPYGFLDGDVLNNDSKLDWADVYSNIGLPPGSISTGIQFDVMNPDDIFTGGSTKDHLPISGWLNKFQDGSSSDKSNILQGGAILIGGRIYFFGNRFSNEGATNIGFWFFQDDVNILNGSFEGEHQIGDILVVMEITNGGAIGKLAAYEWRENEANGGTVPSSTKSLIKIVDENTPQPNLLDAVVNLAPATTPWSYQAKGEPVANLMPPVSFFEGFINIAGLNLTNACFSSFLVETRSSFSITSILEDFLGSNFNVQPLVEIDDLTDCEDEFPQTLTAEVTGGIPPFTFEWKKDGVIIDGQVNSSISVSEAGIYSVTVTGNGIGGLGDCESEPDTATVTIYESVDAGADGTHRFCEGDAVNGVVNLFDIITGEDGGGSWADTDGTGVDISDPTSVDLSALGDGVYVFTYTVTPSGDSTCPPDSSTATITIDDPVDAGTDGTDRFCEGDAVNGVVNLFDIITGEDGGGSWADTDGTGVDISDPTSVDLSTLGDGIYVFTYTVNPPSGSTCPSDSSTATITIDDTVDAGTDGTDRFCVGDEVNGIVNLFDIITGEDAGGSWADTDGTGVDISDPTSVDLSTLSDGTYVFTYTVNPPSGSTCPSDSSTATITIDDTVDAGTDGTDEFCIGDEVEGVVNLFDIITGEDAGGSWADTDGTGVDISDPTSVDLSTLSDGIYVFTYTVNPPSGSTCLSDSSTATITINPLPTVTILDPPSDPVCSSDPGGISAGFQFIGQPIGGTWSGDVNADGTFNPDINESTQTIRYTYTDGVTGCTNYDEISFEFQNQPQDDTDSFEVCLSDVGTIDLSSYIPADATNIEYSGNAVDSNGDVIIASTGIFVANITWNLPGNICRLGISITITVVDCIICETAFAYDDETGICFDNYPDLIPNDSRWGWTNYYSEAGDYTLDLYAGAGQCDISKGTLVGAVNIIDNEDGTIDVQFIADPGYVMSSVHLYVGCEPLPYKKKGNNYEYTVAPGQYPQNPNGDIGYVTDYTIQNIDVSGDFYVIAHVDICTSENPQLITEVRSEAVPVNYSLNKKFSVMQACINSNGLSSKTAETSTLTSSSLTESSEPLFEVAPVPFSNELNIGYLFDYTSNVTIQIFDLNGRLLSTYYDTAVNSESLSTFSVDFKTRSGQIYIVRMTTDREIFTSKIIAE